MPTTSCLEQGKMNSTFCGLFVLNSMYMPCCHLVIRFAKNKISNIDLNFISRFLNKQK